MKMNRHNGIDDILGLARRESHDDTSLTNTVIKEILHYDILYAISQSELSKHLVFHGGTALRLCYQGNRYSEDLDFVTTNPDALEHMPEFRSILHSVMKLRYGLDVKFKDPRDMKWVKTVNLQRWQARILIDRDNKKLTQVHKINIEVADVPSYDNEPMVIQPKYDGLAPGFQHILLRTSTLREIMADKILAFVGRFELKSRDVWDLNWLIDKGIQTDAEMVQKKIIDYKEEHSFFDKMSSRLNEMRSPEFHKAFLQEMSRFVDADLRHYLEDHPSIVSRMVTKVGGHMEAVLLACQSGRSLTTTRSRSVAPEPGL